MPQTVQSRFNGGAVLEVFRIPSVWEGEPDELGVYDEDGGKDRVWRERAFKSTFVRNKGSKVELPPIPAGYGKWDTKSIGGVSKTVRRVNIIRARTGATETVTLFAIRCPTEEAVGDVLRVARGKCSVGDPERVDDEHGIVTEVIVFDPVDLAHVCALVHAAGASVMLEDGAVDAQRCIGIERLDRITAQVSRRDDMYEEDDGVYGLRRGAENWQFPFLPDDWRVPITWDHMVDNVMEEPLLDLPQLLRQHVANRRIRDGAHPQLGCRWEATTPPGEADDARPVLASPSAALVEWIRNPQPHADALPEEVRDTLALKTLVLVDGTWYQPVDPTAQLRRKAAGVGGKRCVSAALTLEQSKQLLTAFYHLCIERSAGPEVMHAYKLIMFRYMQERGYTARWMGKYQQQALHVGNGDAFRNFMNKPTMRMSTYAPHRLPVEVLNRLVGADGRLRSRGSKGSRSKYHSKKARYVPKRRLTRTSDVEQRMVVASTPAVEEI